MSDTIFNDRFHFCALAAGFIAASEDRLDDALYVRELAYGLFKDGAFQDRARRAAPAGRHPSLRDSR